MDYLIDARPVAVSADGTALAGFDHENIAYITVHFDNGFLAHFHVNWLAPVKIRQMLLRRQPAHARLRRHGAEREGARLRQGRRSRRRRRSDAPPDPRVVPHRRHARAEARSPRGAGARRRGSSPTPSRSGARRSPTPPPASASCRCSRRPSSRCARRARGSRCERAGRSNGRREGQRMSRVSSSHERILITGGAGLVGSHHRRRARARRRVGDRRARQFLARAPREPASRRPPAVVSGRSRATCGTGGRRCARWTA